MARTVKVSKEKVEKERAREAGDKKIAIMKKLREENQKRSQRIKNRKEKQLGIIRGKIRETEKDTKRNAISQGDPKIPEGGRFANPKATLSKASSRNCTEKERGTKVTEYSNLSTTRSRGGLLGRTIGTGKYMCHSCKMSDHNAKRYSVSMENQRRFLNKVEIVKEKIELQSSLMNLLDIVQYYHLIVFVLNNNILM